MNWIVYVCHPIDFFWPMLRSVRETASHLSEVDAEWDGPLLADSVGEGQFLSDWASAQEAANSKGWEGDFRHEPCVFWVPGVGGFEYGFVFKQDNNGTTFVVSPRPLPGLDEVSWS